MDAVFRSFFFPKPEKRLSESLFELLLESDSAPGEAISTGGEVSETLPTPNIRATLSHDDRNRDGDSVFGVDAGIAAGDSRAFSGAISGALWATGLLGFTGSFAFTGAVEGLR